MALCKHDMEGGCADCKTVPRAVSPAPLALRDLGPWFAAQFDSECDGCGSDITAGDQIRADGEGGWLCGICGHENEEPAVQFCPVPEYQVPVRPGGPSLAAFLDQYGEGP
jgi:hypothetical protein